MESRSANASAKVHKLIKISVLVNGQSMLGTIDTGASLTLINARIASNLGLRKRIVKGVFIRVISGEQEEARDISEITVNYQASSITIDCYIIEKLPVDLLLGLNWLYGSKAKIDFSKPEEIFSTEYTLGQAFAFLLESVSDTFYPAIDCDIGPYSHETMEIEVSRPVTGTYTLYPDVKIPGIDIPTCEIMLTQGYGKVIVRNFSCGIISLRRAVILGVVDDEESNIDEMLFTDPPPWEAPGKKNELKMNCNLEETQQKELTQVIEKYPDLFSPLTEFGQVKDFLFTITLKDNFMPFSSSPYEKSETDRKLISSQVDEMLRYKVIRKCDKAQLCSPVFTVPKRDGGRRIVVDFRKLNQETIDLRWPIPNMQSILNALSNNKYFTTLDMRSGYWQVPLAEKDKPKTAFITHRGTFEFNVLPFGLKCAPAFFQHMVDTVLDRLVWNKCVAYLDDIFILGKTWEEHVANCDVVFSKLDQSKLKINLNKSEFAYEEVDYLGHRISAEGISPARKNIAPITDFPTPSTVREVKSFLGMANFYRTFIPDLATTAEPLNNLTRKEVPFEWTTECEDAFQKIKAAISTQPVLAYFDESKEIRIYTDACKKGIGGILNQVHDGKERLVACVSRCTSRAEKNYSITELEGLAVVWTLTMLRHYLIGREFVIYTDHHALCFILSDRNETKCLKSNDKLIRWRLRLGDFSFSVVHKSGTKIPHADCISRSPLPIDPSKGPDDLPIFLDGLMKELRGHQEQDVDLKEHIRSNPDGYKMAKGFIYRKREKEPMQLCIPAPLRESVMRMLHDESGHLGRNKVQEKARRRVYWPRMNKDIEEYIGRCNVCQMHAFQRRKQQMALEPIIDQATDFLDLVGVDAIGPLPTTFRGNRFALVLIDYFTKWAEATAVKSITAEATIKFFRHVFSHIGAPRRLLSDNGSNFVAEDTEKYLEEQGVTHIKATPYHPETNGLCERLNKTLKHSLSKLLHDRPKSEWDLLLSDAVWHYNTSKQETTKMSPYYLVYKKEPELVIDRKLPTISPRFSSSGLVHNLKNARNNLLKKAGKMHAGYSHTELKLKVGDTVKYYPPVKHPKVFEKKAEGPFVVRREICPTTFIIESLEDRSTRRAHINSLDKLPTLASEQSNNTLDRSSMGCSVRINDTGHDLKGTDDEEEEHKDAEEFEHFTHHSESDSGDEERPRLVIKMTPLCVTGGIDLQREKTSSWQEDTFGVANQRNRYSATFRTLSFEQVNLTDLLNASSSSEADRANLTEEIKIILDEKKRMAQRFNRSFTLNDSRAFEQTKLDVTPDTSFRTPEVSPNLDETVVCKVDQKKRQMQHDYYRLTHGLESERKSELQFGTSTPATRRVTFATQGISPLKQHAHEQEETKQLLDEAAGGLDSVGESQVEEKVNLNYTVESIMDHRVIDGQMEYLLKWKNYAEPTWTKKRNMNCDRLIAEYNSQREREEREKNETLNEQSKPPRNKGGIGKGLGASGGLFGRPRRKREPK